MWSEKKTEYNFNVVTNEGGKTLTYSPDSGVKLIEQDGFAFKDLAKTGKLLPYEDWRLPAEERAEDLAKRLSIAQIAGLMCYSIHQFNLDVLLVKARHFHLHFVIVVFLDYIGFHRSTIIEEVGIPIIK